jgi:hypothetical protein
MLGPLHFTLTAPGWRGPRSEKSDTQQTERELLTSTRLALPRTQSLHGLQTALALKHSTLVTCTYPARQFLARNAQQARLTNHFNLARTLR